MQYDLFNRSNIAKALPALLCVGAAAALMLAFTVAPHLRETRVPIERPKAEPVVSTGNGAGMLCAGGMEQPADLDLIPDAVVTSATGRESVEYHAELAVKSGRSVGVAWDADVVDDRGNVVQSHLTTGQAKSTAGASIATGAIKADLADGFYSVRVRAAVAPDDGPSTILERVQYVRVLGGKWNELTDIEWRKNSRVSIAFPVAANTQGAVP